MVCSFLVRDLQNAHRNDVQIIDHHVELACIFLLFIFATMCLKAEMIKFVRQVTLDHIHASLVEHFDVLPKALWTGHRTFVHVDFRIKSLLFLL